jgi:hypothetical protein
MERYWCLRWLQQEQNSDEALTQTLDKTTSHSTKASKNDAQVAGYLPPTGEGTNESLRELVIIASVIRENLVRMAEIPLVFRVPSLPEQLPSGTRVQLEVVSIDLLELSLLTRYIATLESATVPAEDDVTSEEIIEVSEPIAEPASSTPPPEEDPAC